MKKEKLSPAMEEMLTNIADGKDPLHGKAGRSAFGGASGTWGALHRRGLLRSGEITPAGLESIGRTTGG